MELIPTPGFAQRDKQEISQRRELTKLGAVRKIPGLRLFCWYQENVFEVTPEINTLKLGEMGLGKEYTVTTIPGAKYVQKLNLENAKKYFRKRGLSVK